MAWREWISGLRARRAAWETSRRLSRFWHAALETSSYGGMGIEAPALDHAVRKDGFAHLAAFARLLGPGPPCAQLPAWVLPHDIDAWRAQAFASKQFWIWKPATSSCGEGIVVGDAERIQSCLQRSAQQAGVVQVYVDRPLLIGGLKFDLRCYFVVLETSRRGGAEPRLYMFLDGLARFATRTYEGLHADMAGSSLCLSRHLTNYSLQQAPRSFWPGARGQSLDAPFLESTDPLGAGGVDCAGRVFCHKWSAAAALEFIASRATCDGVQLVDVPSWDEIGSACASVLSHAFASHRYRDWKPAPKQPYFELFGVDVLIDARGRVKLLEVQRRPCLAPSSALDLRVKSEVLGGLDALLAAPGQDTAPLGWRHLEMPTLELEGLRAREADSVVREWRRVDMEISRSVLKDRCAGALALAEHEFYAQQY